MDSLIKQKWVEALRSSRYKQLRGQLKGTSAYDRATCYCCLGVLYETMGYKWVDQYDADLCQPGDGCLKCEILKKAGLTPPEEQYLAHMNDRGFSFNEIANHIEDTL